MSICLLVSILVKVPKPYIHIKTFSEVFIKLYRFSYVLVSIVYSNFLKSYILGILFLK